MPANNCYADAASRLCPDSSILNYLPQPAAAVTSDGQLLAANDLCLHLLDIDRSNTVNVLGIIRHLLAPQQRLHLEQAWQEAIGGHRSRSWEGPLLTSMGMLRLIRWRFSAMPIENTKDKAVLLIADDLTEDIKKRAVADCVEHSLELVSEIAVITDAHGEILYCNAAATRQTGQPIANVLGVKAISFLEIPEDMSLIRKAMEVLRSGKSWCGTVHIHKKSGGSEAFEATISPWRSPDSHETFHLVIAQRSAELLQHNQASAEHHSLQALTHLANGMAHRFNNVLAGIMGQAELLQMASKELPKALQQRVEKIITATANGRDMIEQLTAFSKKQDKRPRPVDLAQILRNVCQIAQESCPPNVLINTEIPPKMRLARIVAEDVHQATLQLVRNAIEATKIKGGRVDVSLSESVATFSSMPGIHSGDAQSPAVWITVGDNGCGIAPDAYESIFDPFYTTKDMALSAGMGLAVVRGVVERHHGLLEFVSEENKGTLFHIRLPALQDNELASYEAISQGTGERLLLIEADPRTREHSCQQIRELGYRVLAVHSPDEAKRKLTGDQGNFDLLIGNAADIAALKDQFNTPMLVTHEMGDQPKWEPAESIHYLARPCTINELARTIQKAI